MAGALCPIEIMRGVNDKMNMDEVTVVGRLKDMIIRGGENIYPREIEEYLSRHPDLNEVQVFGIPHEKLGEDVCAWVVPEAGTPPTTQDIKQYCTGQIAHYTPPNVSGLSKSCQ